MSLSLTAELDR